MTKKAALIKLLSSGNTVVIVGKEPIDEKYYALLDSGEYMGRGLTPEAAIKQLAEETLSK